MAKINVPGNKNLSYLLTNFLKAVWTLYGKDFGKTAFKDAYLASATALKSKETDSETLKMHLSGALNAVKSNPELIAPKQGFTYGNQVSALPAYLVNAIAEIDKLSQPSEPTQTNQDELAAHSLFKKIDLFHKLARK